MSEELTAEERAYALKRGVHMPEDVPLFAKLVRLYDAALEKRHEAVQEQARLADGCNAALARIAELEAALAACGLGIARAVAGLEKALHYLNDREDVESTPLHAIGHAKTHIAASLEALR